MVIIQKIVNTILFKFSYEENIKWLWETNFKVKNGNASNWLIRYLIR